MPQAKKKKKELPAGIGSQGIRSEEFKTLIQKFYLNSNSVHKKCTQNWMCRKTCIIAHKSKENLK